MNVFSRNEWPGADRPEELKVLRDECIVGFVVEFVLFVIGFHCHEPFNSFSLHSTDRLDSTGFWHCR